MNRPIAPVNLKSPQPVDSWLARLQFALLPPRCLLCRRRSERLRDLCNACAADLAVNHSACARCALPLPVPAPLCGECLKRAPAFDAAHAAFVYGHPLDLLATRLKFGRDLAAGRVLADQWIAVLRADIAQGRALPLPQALLPVPLHSARLRERGYNQALELAKPLAREFGLALAPDLLERIRATAAQSDLDAAARRKNLRGAFVTNQHALARRGAALDHVALVDDVMTTGATLRECARVLKQAGVARVEVWALARAPRGSL